MALSYLQMHDATTGTEMNQSARRLLSVTAIFDTLSVKCGLHSEVYGPFLLCMTLPLLLPLIASFFLLLHALLSKAISSRCGSNQGATAGGEDNHQRPPAYKGRCIVPTKCACCDILRSPVTEGDVEAARRGGISIADFFARAVGCIVFTLFWMYPALVSSAFSLFRCSAPIEGRRVLLADFNTECYTSYHLFYLALAVMSIAVYIVPIPIALYFFTTTPVRCFEMVAADEQDATQTKTKTKCSPQCKCGTRRTAAEYHSRLVRIRFGFLFNGYEVEQRRNDRCGVIPGWEALVMVRKVCFMLPRAVISDPLYGMIASLLVLIVSITVQAYVQPYEGAGTLDLLDVFGLFALIVTQLISIVYTRAMESSQLPLAIDSLTVESWCSVVLVAVHVTALITFFAVWLTLCLKCGERSYCSSHSNEMKRQLRNGDAGVVPGASEGNCGGADMQQTVRPASIGGDDGRISLVHVARSHDEGVRLGQITSL